jgi:hypothetical protein
MILLLSFPIKRIKQLGFMVDINAISRFEFKGSYGFSNGLGELV